MQTVMMTNLRQTPLMPRIVIRDLEENRDLDKEALRRLRGGYLGGYNWQSNWYGPLMGSMSFSPAALAAGGAYGSYLSGQMDLTRMYGGSSYDYIGSLAAISSPSLWGL